jgi:hypothetical protein
MAVPSDETALWEASKTFILSISLPCRIISELAGISDSK